MNQILLSRAREAISEGEKMTKEEQEFLEALYINPRNVVKVFLHITWIEWVVTWQHPVTGEVHLEERRRQLPKGFPSFTAWKRGRNK